jgi:hypothetical protein
MKPLQRQLIAALLFNAQVYQTRQTYEHALQAKNSITSMGY